MRAYLLILLTTSFLLPTIAHAGSKDADGDGFSAVHGDCNDENASVYPGAPELPDGLDNDCDGLVDEGLNYETDCNNGIDDEGDSLVDCEDPDCSTEAGCQDADFDGYVRYVDCDDDNSMVFPGADELCDEVDNDCDSDIDEDPFHGPIWYEDADGDGFGNAEDEGIMACEAPSGHVDIHEDCDDSNPSIHPDADEVCDDEVDNDCDVLIDLEDDECADFDADSDGWPEREDCDDNDADINPDAEEICEDGIDNNCDGSIDEDCTRADTADPDEDSPSSGKDEGSGCGISSTRMHPGPWIAWISVVVLFYRRQQPEG